MDPLEDWFPYPEYRPYQRKMLDSAYSCAKEGGILMVDAPTGSGKSSVIAALLAARDGKKIVVAVRTVSQLNTFIRELALIRKRQPGLKVAYLIGKRSMCPLPGFGDVYRKCEGVKSFSTSLMRQRAEKGALVPSRDPYIQQQIRRNDPQKPLICPFYIGSRVFVETEGSIRMLPSAVLKTKAERVAGQVVWPHQLLDMASGVCPYEMMILAAHRADVILLNYKHLFDEEIQQSLYAALNIVPSEVILLVDEAHNCGDAVQASQSVTLDRASLDQAGVELSTMRRTARGIEALQQVIPRIIRFMDGLRNSHENEDWFDPQIFDRMVIRESLYRDMSGIVEDLMRVSENIREKNIRAGEFRETAIERLTRFLLRITQSSSDPCYLTVFRREDQDIILEVRNIDPGGRLSVLAGDHHACVLISGTLSPVRSYSRYYFGEMPVKTISLPNAFPPENRLILCALDITTAFSRRQDSENLARIRSYIRKFSMLKGNLAIYFPSYQILENFADSITSGEFRKKIFIEPRDAKEAEESLREFLSLPQSGGSGILLAVCGGKWSEGLDYRGDQLQGAMVIGLPLAPFNQVRRMIIQYFRRRFGDEGEFICYTLPALNRAQQALGRVLRTPDDRGVLVFGERRFREGTVYQGLPSWMKEELKECTETGFSEVIRRWR